MAVSITLNKTGQQNRLNPKILALKKSARLSLGSIILNKKCLEI
jgi:hypothetical protein